MKIMSAGFRITVLLLWSSVALTLYAIAPATVNNDDSCDVAVLPAATLLLPHFEVGAQNTQTADTIVTLTNVSPLPRIARLTIWTDWSYPVLSFDVFLTGYDVQPLSLGDLVAGGRLPFRSSVDGESGERSFDNDANPQLDLSGCSVLPSTLPPAIVAAIRSALTTGIDSTGRCPAEQRIGGTHTNATGYLTIDLVQSCSGKLPTDPGYFTSEILYDNVLTADYQQMNRADNLAEGGPLVHIRAIPEGGTASTATNFTKTFYGHLQNGSTADRRQPLPSTFAARWYSVPGLTTDLKIWREAVTGTLDPCNAVANAAVEAPDIVRFDEDENSVTFGPCDNCDSPLALFQLPSSSRQPGENGVFPPAPDNSSAGWYYLNLDNRGASPYRDPSVASQNWVTVSMRGAELYGADFDAVALGNGCSPPVPRTAEDSGGEPPSIGPAENFVAAAFASGAPTTVNNDDSCDVALMPAATLLLPYFEVDLEQSSQTTLFTITNVTPQPRIARATIWSDWSYPLLTFNFFLTGYDVQAFSVYDILSLGRLASQGSGDATPGARSAGNDANPLLDLSACGALPDRIPPALLGRLRTALLSGRVAECSTSVGSDASRRTSDGLAAQGRAIGFVTVDVVSNCNTRSPAEAEYYTHDILYDNALIGDYQQIDLANNAAQANPLVHIRAIPEGGTSRAADTNFRRTFYARFNNGWTGDRRQPLPSTFAAHWIDAGTGGFETTLKIWREGISAADQRCSVWQNERIIYPDVVRFDEEENPTVFTPDSTVPLPPFVPTLPTVARIGVGHDSNFIPPNPDGAVAGWIYLNLQNEDESLNGAAQNWVIASKLGEGRFGVDSDATPLGNGCSPAMPVTSDRGAPYIAPAANLNPLPEVTP